MAIAQLGRLKYKYEKEELSIYDLPEITHDDAKEILFLMKEVCAEFGLNVYLAFGTLLGAVREKDFIKGDLDVDVFIKDEKLLFSHLDYLEKRGLYLIRVVKHNTYSFRYMHNPHCYIDIYVMRKPCNIWRTYCYELCGLATPKKLLKDGHINFLGEVFYCPASPENILKFWYTDTWNIPMDKFDIDYIYTVPSFYYYKKIKKQIKDLIKPIIGWESWKHIVKGNNDF